MMQLSKMLKTQVKIIYLRKKRRYPMNRPEY